MDGNIHIDDLRITAIDEGLVHFETVTGRDTIQSCMAVGKYRKFLAIAQRQIDAWIAAQRPPVQFVPTIRLGKQE